MDKEIGLTKNMMLVMLLIVAAILMLYGSAQMGYKIGAERIKEYKDNYIYKYCFCLEPELNNYTPKLNYLEEK